MEVIYHPLVRGDVEKALTYYRKICARLADEFHAELRDIINRAAENPLRFHLANEGFRRANLNRFPTISFTSSPRMCARDARAS
jgi:hypothetical protein